MGAARPARESPDAGTRPTAPPEPNVLNLADTHDTPLASPVQELQDRLTAAYARGATGPFEWPPLVRLLVLLGSACGLWVCLGGLAVLVMR